MNCNICGSETQAGAKLCVNCRAARHRAFAETVTRPHPALAAVGAGTAGGRNNLELRLKRAARKAAQRAQRASAATVLAERNAAMEPADITAANESWPGRYRHLVAFLLVVAITGVLYVGYRILVPASVAEAVSENTLQMPPVSVAALPTVAPQPAVPVAEPPAPAPDPSTTRAFAGLAAMPGAGGARSVERDGPAGTGADERTRATGSAKGSKSARTKLVAPPVPAVVEAPIPAPIAAPAVAAPVREPPKPDKWQLMDAALIRCGNQNLFARIACEQRVRLQYCDGAWGQVSQCVSGPVNDRGQ